MTDERNKFPVVIGLKRHAASQLERPYIYLRKSRPPYTTLWVGHRYHPYDAEGRRTAHAAARSKRLEMQREYDFDPEAFEKRYTNR